jgi:hypothetical protein
VAVVGVENFFLPWPVGVVAVLEAPVGDLGRDGHGG